VRALYETAGLSREISTIFVEATLLWRDASKDLAATMLGDVCGKLLEKFRRHATHGAVQELLEMIERLHIAEQRQHARAYAQLTSLAAA